MSSGIGVISDVKLSHLWQKTIKMDKICYIVVRVFGSKIIFDHFSTEFRPMCTPNTLSYSYHSQIGKEIQHFRIEIRIRRLSVSDISSDWDICTKEGPLAGFHSPAHCKATVTVITHMVTMVKHVVAQTLSWWSKGSYQTVPKYLTCKFQPTSQMACTNSQMV